MPKHINDLHISLDQLDTKNYDHEEILLINDTQKHIAVFGTRRNLSEQDVKTYSTMFQVTIEKAAEIGDFYPETIDVDFEIANHNAIKEACFENLVGCWFHLIQTWWEKFNN